MPTYDPKSSILKFLDTQLTEDYLSSVDEKRDFFTVGLKPMTLTTVDADEHTDIGTDDGLPEPRPELELDLIINPEYQENLKKKISILNKIKHFPHNDVEAKAKFFTPFVDRHWELARQYSVLRRRFREDLKRAEKAQSAAFTQRVGDLMILAALLEGVNDHCLNAAREKRRYLRDQRVYDQILFDNDFQSELIFDSDPSVAELGTQTIRDNVIQLNPFRLMLVRLRRIVLMLSVLLEFQKEMGTIENGGSFLFFSNLAWVFFLPRLLTNLGLIYKHVFDRSAMTDIEHALGWQTRLRAELVRCWQELANDMGWFSSGITTCFFLAGKTPLIGTYLALAMQAYDFVVVLTRFCIELRRLDALKQDYRDIDDGFIADLEDRRAFDRRELGFSLFNFGVLLLCAILMTPSFASISPIIPLLAAITAFLITIVNYAVNRWFVQERQRLYDGELIAPDVRCVLTLDEIPDSLSKLFKNDTSAPFTSDDISKISLGVFFAGYIRIKNADEDKLIYVNKKTQKIINLQTDWHFDAVDLDIFDNITTKSARVKTLTFQQLEKIKAMKKFNKADLEAVDKQAVNVLTHASQSIANFSEYVMG
ncbi:MAG: hypothetical protein Q8R83_09155 [Legionellaceae bacterium]|nr:hypothetical protein [Legionellaceae bacterium]